MIIKRTFTRQHEFIIDDEDYELIREFNWYTNNEHGIWYVKARIDGRPIKLQNFLMHPPEGMVVDHINRNALDNRRANLRVCTQQENLYNRGPLRNSTSKFKGVSWDKSRNKWVAAIRVDGKNITIGRFASEIDAALAYDAKALESWGEFAYLNAPLIGGR